MRDKGRRSEGLGKKNSELIRGCFCCQITGTCMTSTCIFMGTEYQNPHLDCCCLTLDVYRDVKQLQHEVCNNLILSPYKVFPEVPGDVCDHVSYCHRLGQMGQSPEKLLHSGVY